jgi:exonuclease VII small subunit
MSDPTSIFGETQNPQGSPSGTNSGTGNPANSQNADPVANLLGSIKNERGEQKYKSLEDALTALQHSQTYIPQLTTQLKEREQELETARRESDKIAELERTLQTLTQTNTQSTTTQSNGLSEEAVAEIVSRTLSRTQQETLQKQNIGSVVAALQTTFGAEAEAVYNKKAQELGMTVPEFNALAAKTPKAVLEMIGVRTSAQNTFTPSSSVNSGAFAPNQQSFIGRNQNPTLIGATSQDLLNESRAARKMVDELHAQGKSVHDLSDPKVYNAFFNT